MLYFYAMRFFKLALLTILLTFLAVYTTVATAQEVQEPRSAQSFSRELQVLVEAAREVYSGSEIYIGGGTARSLIKHVYLGTPFDFRDFDIVLSAAEEVTADSARQFGLELEQRSLGRFSEENLRPRPRYNPALPPGQAEKYNAGFGFFVLSPEGIEFDISIFHSKEALNLNGILDTDMLRIRISENEDLQALLGDLERFERAIHDPEGGMETILKSGIPHVIQWGSLEKEPGNVSIRIIRGLAKFGGLPVDELTATRIRRAMANSSEGSLQIARNLLKLLEDESWEAELRALDQVGLFQRHFKSFARALDNPAFLVAEDLTEKVALLVESAGKVDGLRFLKVLADLEPQLIRDVLPRLIRSKELKVGYFTGEFAPFHEGHLGVAQTALDRGGLDLVFVIPTPHATNDPKTVDFSEAEWSERRAFVRAGIAAEERAWLWPSKVEPGETPKLRGVIESLESYIGSDEKLTHVMGMDSMHRVVGRGLIGKDPRPRIVVTRMGVPHAEGAASTGMTILPNVNPAPISATRILHEIALNGTSQSLAPDVLKLVLSTRRYHDLLNALRTKRDISERAIRPVSNMSEKILIWDPRENHAGLFAKEFPEFNETHERVINELERIGADKLVVYIKHHTRKAVASWERAIEERSGRLLIQVAEDYRSVPDTDRVMVMHSGRANEGLSKGLFADGFRGTKGAIFYETPDQPLSPILRSLRTATVIDISPAGGSCRAILSAAGF